jgi:hypothetical protein
MTLTRHARWANTVTGNARLQSPAVIRNVVSRKCACGALDVEGGWRTHHNEAKPLCQLVAAFHPSARVSNERMARAWELLSGTK